MTTSLRWLKQSDLKLGVSELLMGLSSSKFVSQKSISEVPVTATGFLKTLTRTSLKPHFATSAAYFPTRGQRLISMNLKQTISSLDY